MKLSAFLNITHWHTFTSPAMHMGRGIPLYTHTHSQIDGCACTNCLEIDSIVVVRIVVIYICICDHPKHPLRAGLGSPTKTSKTVDRQTNDMSEWPATQDIEKTNAISVRWAKSVRCSILLCLAKCQSPRHSFRFQLIKSRTRTQSHPNAAILYYTYNVVGYLLYHKIGSFSHLSL